MTYNKSAFLLKIEERMLKISNKIEPLMQNKIKKELLAEELMFLKVANGFSDTIKTGVKPNDEEVNFITPTVGNQQFRNKLLNSSDVLDFSVLMLKNSEEFNENPGVFNEISLKYNNLIFKIRASDVIRQIKNGELDVVTGNQILSESYIPEFGIISDKKLGYNAPRIRAYAKRVRIIMIKKIAKLSLSLKESDIEDYRKKFLKRLGLEKVFLLNLSLNERRFNIHLYRWYRWLGGSKELAARAIANWARRQELKAFAEFEKAEKQKQVRDKEKEKESSQESNAKGNDNEKKNG
jgi:hypothetical protein